MRVFLLAGCISSFAFLPAAAAQSMPPVGAVDLYGLRSVPEHSIRRAIAIEPGTAVPDSTGRAALVARLARVPGVRRVELDAVCCEEGQTVLYVGVVERGTPEPKFRPPPDGGVRLPAEVVLAGAAYDRAFAEAVGAGDFEEDRSAGHSLLHYPAARRAQEAFIPLAARHESRLREVLRDASDPDHRARAAEVLGYHPDKRAVVADLVAAAGDPDPGVRNDAVRALAVIAVLDAARPELGIGVPAEPFISLVNSTIWTDRNKGSLALASVTERRDPAVLAAIRRNALPALIEMGRWKSPGHAAPALLILGRIAGMSDDEIVAAIQRNERDPILSAARRRR